MAQQSAVRSCWVWGLALLMAGAWGNGVFGADAAPAQPRKPNIVLFLADDVGWGELGFQGEKTIPTPHIDSIAKNGVRFTQGYVSGTVCSPSRAGLMTGRYPTRFGHEFNETAGKNQGAVPFGLPLTETTLAQRLKALGYATACIGKWHLGNTRDFLPTNRGFDEFYGTLGNTPYREPRNFIDSRKGLDILTMQEANFYTTDAYRDRAVDWIRRHQDKPFFLYMPFNAVHTPLEATPPYLQRVSHIPDEQRRTYAAMTVAMDDAVGAVLQQIREMGQEENTLVFFLSDNGGPTAVNTSSNQPLRGCKYTTDEGGTRVPFCVQWKGVIPAGRNFQAPVINLDIFPTAVVAAGGTVDPAWRLDGVDLLPYLTGAKPGQPHHTLYWRFGQQWAVRQGDWKITCSYLDDYRPRLIHIANDPGETTDRAADHPERFQQLQLAYEAWSAQQREPLWPAGNLQQFLSKLVPGKK